MDPNLAFILAIIELVAKYGVPGVIDIIEGWGVKNPTLEQIQELKNRVPHPDSYDAKG